ncbi:MAG TPA: sulfate ABC transporter permease subunit CysT [Chloroflexota bacterium]
MSATAQQSPVALRPGPSAPRARRAPRSAVRPGGLALGLSTLYLSIIVLLPLAAVAVKAVTQSPSSFWQSVTNPTSIKALVVTLVASLLTAAIGAVTGTLVAWVLVRDQFPGQRFINALIDLPFALPTVVAGLTLLALYGPDSPFGVHLAFTRAIVLVALLFITLPFVVRSVQPVLLELDREVEEAAASLGASNGVIFRRIVLPALRPAILSGAALAFARAVGEIGSLVLIVGKVQIASIVIFADIESDAPQAAASLSLVLILVSLIVLVLIRRLGGRVGH